MLFVPSEISRSHNITQRYMYWFVIGCFYYLIFLRFYGLKCYLKLCEFKEEKGKRSKKREKKMVIAHLRFLSLSLSTFVLFYRGIPERVYPFSKGVCRNLYDFCCARSSFEQLPTPREIEEKARPYTCYDAVTCRCCWQCLNVQWNPHSFPCTFHCELHEGVCLHIHWFDLRKVILKLLSWILGFFFLVWVFRFVALMFFGHTIFGREGFWFMYCMLPGEWWESYPLLSSPININIYFLKKKDLARPNFIRRTNLIN